MNRMEAKQQNRKIRVLRLLAIVQTYHHYTMMQLNSELLKRDNNWQDAEQMSDLMNMLIPCRNSSPTDFLHDKDEVSDTVLDNYEGFKNWMSIAEKVGISEKALTAFCKNVDNLQSVFQLKIYGHVLYPYWLIALLLYLENAISKKELQGTFFEISLFSGKAVPANFAAFREAILEIEKVIAEIADKQEKRGLMK